MQNRVSWSMFDKMRKEQGLSTPNSKRNLRGGASPEPKCCKHGNKIQNLHIDRTALLQEASAWSPDKKINWSDLARRHGVNKSNGGQIIKELFAEEGIPAAEKADRPHIAQRRSKQSTSSKVSFPKFAPVSHHKQLLSQKIDDGELLLGTEIVETPQIRYKVDQLSQSIVVETLSVYGRHIDLFNVREKILKKHEALGIIRDNGDQYYARLPQQTFLP